MNVKSSRSTILILLAILLGGCGTRAHNTATVSKSPLPSANSAGASTNLDLFRFIRNDRFGYIDSTGKIIIPAQFDRAENFSEGLATVEVGGKFGCIDKTGKLVIPARFNFINKFKNGLAAANTDEREGKVGYIDRTGKLVISARFNEAREFSEGLAAVKIDRKFGYINSQGKVIIPFQFDEAAEFKNGFAKVRTDIFRDKNPDRTIDKTGKLLSGSARSIDGKDRDRLIQVAHPLNKAEALKAEALKPGFVKNNAYYMFGYKDRTGKMAIPLQYFTDAAPTFSNGLAWVIVGNRLGYIDKTGKLAIPARYGVSEYSKGERDAGRLVTTCGRNYCFSASSNFDRGLAAVAIPRSCNLFEKGACNDYGYIDPTGKLVFKF
ncbi:WG repeat-containing protein [Chamaesiphon sp. VAR_48_metabat_403]|uniref:WG repeat-containing protein n=1 Tax=Chamaesiphon sp. VAR_48_metabat_403 TaxID=2964700 RepID=UPI00286E811F|nr:WG repeat-containing protein [Chamaesiphon sp. VAR_48_metabat_403]